jgi:hypothetical protein
MDLSEIDKEAAILAQKRARLDAVELELEQLIRALRDLPRRAERESRFAKLTGRKQEGQDPVARAEKRQGELSQEREVLSAEVDDIDARLIDAIAAEAFTVPLSDEPVKQEGFWVFPFRADAACDAGMRFISEKIGLGDPIPIEGTLLSAAGVRVPIEFEMDVNEAMDRVVKAIEQIQNTMRIKRPPTSSGW